MSTCISSVKNLQLSVG